MVLNPERQRLISSTYYFRWEAQNILSKIDQTRTKRTGSLRLPRRHNSRLGNPLIPWNHMSQSVQNYTTSSNATRLTRCNYRTRHWLNLCIEVPSTAPDFWGCRYRIARPRMRQCSTETAHVGITPSHYAAPQLYQRLHLTKRKLRQ